MIKQIAPVSPATSRINKDLAKARLIQAKLKDRVIDVVELENGILWSPITSGPYLVPIIRWIE